MVYFYNTLGVLGAILLIVLVYEVCCFILRFSEDHLEKQLDYASEESKKAREWMKNFKKTSWIVVRTSQPRNDKMITLHLRSFGNESMETEVCIDKGKY